MQNNSQRSRTIRLGLYGTGGVFFAGGLAGVVRAGRDGGTEWRFVFACVTAAIGVTCLVCALLLRRRSAEER